MSANDILVSLHGRRFGITNGGGLALDGKIIASQAEPIHTTFAGRNGAGAITLAGTVVGDKVISVINLTTPADASASFEATITVAGQIQQSSASNLTASTYLVNVSRRT